MFIVHNENQKHIFQTFSQVDGNKLDSVTTYTTEEQAREKVGAKAEVIFLEKLDAIGHMPEETNVIDSSGCSAVMTSPIEEVINTFHL
jgi:hypothetical protein